MSNRLLIPKSKRFLVSPSIIRPRAIIPGVMPIPRASKPPVVPGSRTFSTAGAFNFTVPNFNTLTVTLRGAGGGGGGFYYSTDYDSTRYPSTPGSAGGATSWNGLVANGGQPGTESNYIDGVEEVINGSAGAAGGASGGTTNTTGGGNAGGAGSYTPSYGGGRGGNGGAGGLASKTFAVGQLTPGAVLSGTVGAPGGGGSCVDPGFFGGGYAGQPGTGASITFTWS
ncbi:hypothetical protein [Bradyrhizobium sp. ERR14]|uniref:hypothetical protein n=1 Tax=Bradyrhizobium sp. ERR14 TaxID=2663837 RepID=UPI001611BD80|nr:hypothetical protein [Bradyrhizobium sp. ERR14]MBB4398747.1 hypothetical protein [Bradyrhizobium sp. ERR14]